MEEAHKFRTFSDFLFNKRLWQGAVCREVDVWMLGSVTGRPSSISVPGSTIGIPRSNLSRTPLARLLFQLWLPFIKNTFQKALLHTDSTL